MHGYFLREGGSVGSLEATQKLNFLVKTSQELRKLPSKLLFVRALCSVRLVNQNCKM